MAQQHSTQQEAKEAALQALADACDTGQWCAVIFSSDGRRVIMHRTTYHFNFADIHRAVDLMQQWADEELAKETVPRPLPLAPHIRGENGKQPFKLGPPMTPAEAMASIGRKIPTPKEIGGEAKDLLSDESIQQPKHEVLENGILPGQEKGGAA